MINSTVSRIAESGAAGMFLALLLLSGAAEATDFGERELKSVAMRDGDNRLVVISDGHAVWATGREADKAFDGNLGTYYDPKQVADNTYVGYQLQSPQVVTRVRFQGYSSADSIVTRMRSCVVQGACQSDFSDAVPLVSFANGVPDDWKSDPHWIEGSSASSAAFTYIRLLQPKNGASSTFAGNVAELEVFGMDVESYKAFDNDVATELALADGDTLGRDFGEKVEIGKIRFVAGASADALVGGVFEVSDKPDFSVRSTVHAIVEAPLRGINEIGLKGVSGRYVRFVPAQDCSVAEMDFVSIAAPVGFTLAPSGTKDQVDPVAVLSWRPAAGGRTVVEKAPGEGGPWATAATFSAGEYTWRDSDAVVGVLCHYRVRVPQISCGETIADGMNETVCSYRRIQLLERDRNVSMTALRSGVSAVYKYGGTVWTPTTSTTTEGVMNSVMLAFDNKWPTGSDSAHNAYNYPDLKKTTPRVCLGVDFGDSPCYVESARINWGRTGDNKNRVNGAVLSGSNSSTWNENFTDLFSPLQHSGENYHWYDCACSPMAPYRFLFVHNESNADWGCNISELQLFGWPAKNVQGQAFGASGLTVAGATNGRLTLSWTPAIGEGTFAVERRTNGGDWSTVADGLDAATWTDSNCPYDGTTYSYRVKTVNGDAFAYSATVEKTPYEVGAGVGLHGVWNTDYESTAIGSVAVHAETNAVVELMTEQTDLLVRWFGKLIVPFEGDWTFDAEADDTLALWIDGQPILYREKYAGVAETAPRGAVRLTAGEHDIRADYFQKDGTGVCRLYWRGPVAREIIPQTQLIPVAPPELPEPWVGARTFSACAHTNFVGYVRVNAGGTYDLAFGGDDLYYARNGYTFLWQELQGDFVMTVRMQPGEGIDRWNGQKGGLMVRAGTDASAPFEAYLVQATSQSGGIAWRYGCKYRSTTGANISDAKSIGASGTWEVEAPAMTSLRLKRRGGKFLFYGKLTNGSWRLLFERDVPASFGDTVYVGPAAAGASNDNAYVPHYYWRFSDVKTTVGVPGMSVIVR